MTNPSEAICCRNCRFADRRPYVVQCRRFPPVNEDGDFPCIDNDDWCGEFQSSEPRLIRTVPPTFRDTDPARHVPPFDWRLPVYIVGAAGFLVLWVYLLGGFR